MPAAVASQVSSSARRRAGLAQARPESRVGEDGPQRLDERRRLRGATHDDRPTFMGTTNPLTPSSTASTWPAMRDTTAGVPHAAASLTVIPHPSRCEVLATTQARRYNSRRPSSSMCPGSSNQSSAPTGAPMRLETRPLVALAHDHGPQVGDRPPHLGQHVHEEVETLDLDQPAHGDDEGLWGPDTARVRNGCRLRA